MNDFSDKKQAEKKEINSAFLAKIKNIKKDIFTRLDEFLLYAIFFLTPLFFLPLTAFPLNLNKQAFVFFSVMLILFLWLFSFINKGEIKFKKNLPLGLLFFFFIIGVASWLANDKTNFSLLGITGNEASSVINLFILFAVFFLVQSILGTKEKVKTAMIVFAVSSFLTASFWFLSFNSFGKSIFSAGFNTIGSLNSLVLFLLPGFLILLAYFFDSRKIFKNIIFLAILLFFYSVFVFLGFSFSWYLLVFALVLIIVFYFSSKENFDNKKIKMFLTLLFLVVSLLFSFSNLSKNASELRISFGATKNIITAQYENSLKELFFGGGPAGFDYTFLKYKENIIPDMNLNRLRFSSGFSAVTDYFSDLGFIAGSLFVLFLLSVILLALKFLFSEMKKNRYDPVFLGLFTVVVVLFSEVIFSSQNFSILFFAVAFAALLLAYQKNDEKTLSLPEEPQKIFFILIFILAFMVVLVFMSYQFFQRYAAEIYFKKAQDSFYSDESDEALKLLKKSFDFYDKDARYFLFEGNIEFRSLQKKLDKMDPTDDDAKKDILSKLNYIENLYKEAVKLNKKEANTFVSLASLYEFKAEFDPEFLKEAQKYYKEAQKLDPKNTDILFASGIVYYKSGNAEEAKKIFLKISSLYPKDAKVRVYLGLSYFSLGDKKLALKELQSAKILDPDNKDIDELIDKIKSNKNKK